MRLETEVRLSIRCVWVDESDGMLQLEFSLANRGLTARSSEIFIYPEKLKAFARGLCAFPAAVNDCCSLLVETGSSLFQLTAYVWDGVGHTALEMRVRQDGSRVARVESCFSAMVEAAALNAWGQRLQTWADRPTDELVFESPGIN